MARRTLFVGKVLAAAMPRSTQSNAGLSLTHTHAPTSAPTGGLGPEVTEQVLHAAFIPFGEVTTVQIPMDMRTRMASPPLAAGNIMTSHTCSCVYH